MLRVALSQLDLVVGAVEANAERIVAASAEAARAQADLMLTPELAISGYPPEDLLFRPAFLAACRRVLDDLAGRVEVPVLVGAPVLAGDRVHNSAFLLADGEVRARYDKQHLPNYGVFDEERTFAPGRRGLVFAIGDARCAVTICEDLWLADGPASRAAQRGATVILNLSSSPYHLGKGDVREEMLRTRARDELAAIAYCNLVGGQDELVFDGRSFAVDADGDVVARAAAFAEELLVCELDPAAAVAARLRDTRLRRGSSRRPAEPAVRLEPAAPRPARPARIATPPAPLEAEVWNALELGLRDYAAKNGFERVLLGMSGGIDSALVAALAADALGADRVDAISMPTRYNADATRSDARRVAEALSIGFRELPIEDLRAAFAAALPDTTGVAAENVQARIRGLVLMTVSNQHGHLVLTTSNKSETAVGYTTLYGDSAGGFAPIKDVPKTLVFRLARWLNEAAGRERIPVSVIERPPSAELRDDQRDDQSLPPYEVLDPILEAYVERDLTRAELIEAGYDAALVQRVTRMVDVAEWKRRQAPIGVRVTPKAFGKDRRLPITNKYRG